MEDGSGGVSSSSAAEAAAVIQNKNDSNNGKTTMANFPIGDQTTCSSPLKVNGDSASATTVVTPPDDTKDTNSSDCDALVIDEPRSPSLTKIKEEQEEEVAADEDQDHLQQQFTHTNPYFSESIFELSNQYNKPDPQVEEAEEEDDDEELAKVSTTISTTTNGKKVPRKKHKLREYAQYLGLQPTVQFKCSKCGSAGFPSLQVLNEHLVNCTSRIPLPPPAPLSNNATNFRVTRKVFLCSACGTYYENWNLFLHMREVHKRFICLYCLGMFPHAEKLSLHLVSKHNCAPGRFETVKDFFSAYKEPCFLMCCDCQAVFNEQEDFSNHICIDSNNEPPGDELKQQQQQRLQPVEEENNSNTTAVAAAAITTTDSISNCDNNVNETDTTMVVDQQTDSNDDQSTIALEDTKSEVEKAPAVLNGDVDNCCADERPIVNDEKCDEKLEVEEGEEDNPGVEINDNNGIREPENDHVEENDEDDDGDNNQEDMDVDDSESGRSSPADEDEEEAAISPPPSPSEPEVYVNDERKVPKVTLKLPKISNYSSIADEEEEEEEYDEDEDEQSDDSEKLTMEVDKAEEQSDVETGGGLLADNVLSRDEMQQPQGDDEVEDDGDNIQNQSRTNGADEEQDEKSVVEEEMQSDPNAIPTAGSDIAIIELELEQPLDKFDIRFLLQKCLKATVATCLYCNHARRIAVNGKQLGLHAISDHRFSAIVKSITAEELIPESFNNRIKECFEELENIYFSLESTFSNECVTYSHMFECFQCRYSTSVHKELYLHNRKLHAKAILLCTMCKTSFYSYSELICHLCPGLYVLEYEVQFRCCLCVSDDLPSAFRLMVHLRKRHHVCDVCLEMCHNQSRLSNHIWKHKLHHLCYRCGIAYRNKPDITKHLYWKHGTESVLCKRCQQKKWPHVYHFCIPPTSFTCEECNLSFSKAVRLMVHKRQHENNFPHICAEEDCTEKFISKKLLEKHSHKHREPVKEEDVEDDEPDVGGPEKRPSDVGVRDESQVDVKQDDPKVESENQKSEAEPNPSEPPKPTKVDVYDLPVLNLSESDSSESDEEDNRSKPSAEINATNTKSSFGDDELDALILTPGTGEVLKTDEEGKLNGPVPILENVWDDFKNYQANIAKLDILTDVGKDDDDDLPKILTDIPEVLTVEVALRDHDYCAPTMDTLKEEEDMFATPTTSVLAADTSADHDYCTAQVMPKPEPPLKPEPEQKSGSIATKPPPSSDSSSDSDSSSCTCGSNCSCSSSSDSSSSSSDSSESDSSSEEGRRRQQVRRERRRQKKTKQQHKSSTVASEQKPAAAPTTAPEVAPKPKVVVPKKEIPIMESDLETTESDTDEDFYDKEPQKLANKMLAEKRERLLQMAGIGTYVNGSMIDSRPSTPSLPPEEVKVKKSKSKSKKKKKKKSSRHEQEKNTMQTLTIPTNSPSYSAYMNSSPNIVNLNIVNNSFSGGHEMTPGVHSEMDSNTRASKRRRVPNKFYGYSSDEETEKSTATQGVPNFKFRKMDLPSPVVPPITIKALPPQTVEPISIRMTPKSGEMRVQPLRLPFPKIARTGMPRVRKPQPHPVVAPPPQPPMAAPAPAPVVNDNSDSNSTSSEDETVPTNVIKEQPALYCYCRCPYDEVSEMIGCDADDCAIEWFHFECVGIMVPPKGQWYCPDCRKKKQQRRDMQHSQMSS